MLHLQKKYMDKSLHIGNKIREILHEKRIGLTKFSKMLGCHLTSVNNMVRKKHLHTTALMRVSHMLEYDFFQHYISDIGNKPNEELKNALEEMEKLKQENKDLMKENQLLREMIGLITGNKNKK